MNKQCYGVASFLKQNKTTCVGIQKFSEGRKVITGGPKETWSSVIRKIN
jgi:hypothetical protein